jgi:Mn2+/Fe2+ NRAMP family transporter
MTVGREQPEDRQARPPPEPGPPVTARAEPSPRQPEPAQRRQAPESPPPGARPPAAEQPATRQAAPRAPAPGPAAPAAGPAAPAPAPGRARPAGQQTLSRPSAVLDEAHEGDIEGALGRIRAGDEPRSGWRRRLVTFLAIVGPGLIVMVGDNDAGGVSTYAQAGQNYGYSLLWVLLLLIPVLIVNQEMVVRLGAVTGVGHARLINERFGRFWGWFSVGDLFLLNFLTIVTEFIGVSLALAYFGVSKYIAVPIAAVLLVAITASGSFARWERAVFFFIATSLVLFPLAFASHPSYSASIYHLFVPGVQGGVSSTAILLIIAIVGTTVAPWQLFFQQSNVIDKRITPRFIGYERADTFLGAFVVIVGAGAVLVIADFAVRGTSLAGHFTDALGVANALALHGYWYGALFSIVLLDASIIGATAVTLSTSYAFGDVFGIRHSLHRSFRSAKPFYASYAALVTVAAAIVLIPGAPLGLITTAVQALAGVLLPSASTFLLLLCNDREVLGPWVNKPWLNAVAIVIIGTLLELSGILVVTTVFSSVSAGTAALWMGSVLVGVVAVAGAWLGIRNARRAPAEQPRRVVVPAEERMSWRMPPLALLKPVQWSPVTKLGMIVLRGYLAVSVLLLIVKAVQLGGG